VNGLNEENYKPLKKEFEEDYRRWKDFLFPWVSRMNTVKMAILSKSVYMFNAIPMNSQRHSSQRFENLP
jgi:hypothetical protein